MPSPFTYGHMQPPPFPSDKAAQREAYLEAQVWIVTPDPSDTAKHRRIIKQGFYCAYWRAVEQAVAHSPFNAELPDWILRPGRIGYGFSHANQNSAHVLGQPLNAERTKWLGNAPAVKVKTAQQRVQEFADIVGFEV